MKTSLAPAVWVCFCLCSLAARADEPKREPVRLPREINYGTIEAAAVRVTAQGRVFQKDAKPVRVDWVIIFSGVPEEVAQKLREGNLSGLTGNVQEIANTIQGATKNLKEFARNETAEAFGDKPNNRGTVEYYANEAAAEKSAQKYESMGFRLKKPHEFITGRLYAHTRYAPDDYSDVTCAVTFEFKPEITPEGTVSLHAISRVGEPAAQKPLRGLNEAAMREKLNSFKREVEDECGRFLTRINQRRVMLPERYQEPLRKGEHVVRAPIPPMQMKGSVRLSSTVNIELVVRGEPAPKVDSGLGDDQWKKWGQ